MRSVQMRSAAAALLFALPLLSGCAYQDSKLSKQAEHSLVGMSVADLDICAGLPTKTEKINPATEMRSYERTAASSNGVTLTLPIIGGGMTLGSGGDCHATFKTVNGRVTALEYAGATSVVGEDGANCAPIVRTCVEDVTTRVAAANEPQTTAHR